MKREELYREIGLIDENLIEAAGHSNFIPFWQMIIKKSPMRLLLP
ncbi:hypothetical protein [Paenibacillus riograndensis]|uniref:Uncharacterized protein n=1 Tax=Paenibacillus riograndensis SBR5 TaxID=1073571 RepID=A0A0E4HEF5_9BACL|nr:hypothetical protein [Paenibacillus riograndensis]CQR59059.1 hypothetical protein PRIO_6712 [Paenibacillus riograndensis SBR5]